MIVVDAGVAVNGLLHVGASRDRLQQEDLHAPHLIDSELVNVFTRFVRAGEMSAAGAEKALAEWTVLGVRRYPARRLLPRIWELRQNVSSYDATYVALAELLELPLVTADKRLSRAPGVRCEVVVLRL